MRNVEAGERGPMSSGHVRKSGPGVPGTSARRETRDLALASDPGLGYRTQATGGFHKFTLYRNTFTAAN